MALKKTAKGWQVLTLEGKPASQDDLTRVEAEEREKEIKRMKDLTEEQKKTSKWVEAHRKK